MSPRSLLISPSLSSILPYRLRRWIDQRRLHQALRHLPQLGPLHVHPASQADVELHMLLCQRDLRIGLLALKSLLRHQPPRWAVALSQDGSLSAADVRFFNRQLPGCRWIDWPATDPALTSALAGRPHLHALYHSRYAPVCKLLHPLLLAQHARVIVLDPDTAFFQRPERLLRFALGQDPTPLYMHDHQDETKAVPPTVEADLLALAQTLAPPGRTWQLAYRLFNSGLLAFQPSQLDLDLAEKYLAWCQALPPDHKTGPAAIWFGPWTPEQTCYHVMFALSQPPAQPLGADYHLGGQPGHVFNHFLRHYLVRPSTHLLLKNLVDDIRRDG